MRVIVLGPVEVEGPRSGASLGPRDRIALAALAVRYGEVVTVDQLADALWGDGPPASAVKVIHGCISRLRRVLGADAITTVPGGYRGTLGALDLDRAEFEALAGRAREHARAGLHERAAALFTQALALWRGAPFAELEEWEPARLEAIRLRELRLAVQEELLQVRLDSGEHLAVAAEATVAVGEEPWRERRWAVLALAQYRSGRQADALASIRTARRALGSELGLDPGSELAALERAILEQDPALGAEHEARVLTGICPWKGLAAYGAEDHDDFFGRAGDIAGALGRLDAQPLLVLAGPSGSGKSSLMLAGLLPALRRRGRQVASFTPGVDPAAAMAACRAGSSGEPVLLIDQFDEVFTLTDAGFDRAAWLTGLATYALERAPVVLTLRADLLAQLTVSAPFARLAERGVLLVGPLDGKALRESVEEPARRTGLRMEPGLVDLVLRDAEDQPGALPLLSHALVETWRRRERGLLTVEAYEASGGIRGAVAASADRLFESLAPVEQGQVRRLVLRMVSLGDGGEPISRSLPAATVADDPTRRRLLDLLVRARLVTADESSYRIAHEALACAWPRLRGWLEEDAEEQRVLNHLTAAATAWDIAGRPDSDLYRGGRLARALEWLWSDGADPTTVERDFLTAARAGAEDARRAAEQQVRRERRTNRRLRVLLIGAAGLLLVAGLLAIVAVDRSRDAAGQRDVAEGATVVAEHESLVERSLTLRSTNLAAAALLAVEAYRAQPDALSRSALLGALTSSPGFMGYRKTPFPTTWGTTVPGGREAVLALGTHVRTADLATGRLGPEIDAGLRDATTQTVVRVSADGRRLAQVLWDPDRLQDCATADQIQASDGRGCAYLIVYDLVSGRRVFGPAHTPLSMGDVAINDDGSLVAVVGGYDGDLATYDVDSGRMIGRLDSPPRPPEAPNWRDTGAAVFAGHDRVWLGSLAGPLRLVDARTLAVRRTVPVPARTTHNFLRLTPGGMLVGVGDAGLVAIDTRTGRRLWSHAFQDSNDEWPCFSFAVAARAGRLYCGSAFGEIEERDLATGDLTGTRLDPQRGEIRDLAVTGDELVAFGAGYEHWRLDGSGLAATAIARGRMSEAGFDPSGTYYDTVPVAGTGRRRIVRADSGARVATFGTDVWVTWIGNATLLVLPEHGGSPRLVDVATRQTRTLPEATYGAITDGYPGRDGDHGWIKRPLDDDGSTWGLDEIDLRTGALTGLGTSTEGELWGASTSRSGLTFVNYLHGGDFLDDTLHYRGTLLSAAGRRGPEASMFQGAIGTVEGKDAVVGADLYGALEVYDPVTMRPVQELPGSKGQVGSIRFSADGAVLLVDGYDQDLQLYDPQSWVRIGVITATGSQDAGNGFLRPDGRALLVNARAGAVLWDLDAAAQADAACALAGRNLTRTEWAAYLGHRPYQRTCRGYPAGG